MAIEIRPFEAADVPPERAFDSSQKARPTSQW